MKNHYVPQVYMKGFLDTSAPKNLDPYLWIYDNKEDQLKKKAPSNVLFEKNLYTEYTSELEKIHLFEEYLAKNIDEPFGIFRRKFEKLILNFDTDSIKQNFTDSDREFLAFFMIWQLRRTKKSLDGLDFRMKQIYMEYLPEVLEDSEQNRIILQNERIRCISETGFEYQGIRNIDFLKKKNIGHL